MSCCLFLRQCISIELSSSWLSLRLISYYGSFSSENNISHPFVMHFLSFFLSFSLFLSFFPSFLPSPSFSLSYTSSDHPELIKEVFVLNADKFVKDYPAFDAFTSVLDVVQQNKTRFLPRFRVPWCDRGVGRCSKIAR